MNTNTVLNKVRELLGMQIELEQRKLDDGVTVVEADAFEAEAEIFIVTEDEQKIALPVGEYKLEDGMVIVVSEEGVIAEVKEAEEAEEEKKEEEEEVKEEAGYEEKEEEMAEEKKPVKKTVESIVKETFFTEIEALKKENEDLKAEIELLSKDKTEETTNEVENKEEVVELSDEKTESVEAATKPITHNPENVEEKEVFKFSSKRRKSTMDSIFEKLNK
jgi:putative cell wall-binding protein